MRGCRGIRAFGFDANVLLDDCVSCRVRRFTNARELAHLFCTVIKLMLPPLLVLLTQLSGSSSLSFSVLFLSSLPLAAGGSGETSPSSRSCVAAGAGADLGAVVLGGLLV